MASAEVGDDGYGEDPTVRALEETYAEVVAKDAALFVPSGTMANQLALRVLCRPGALVVAGRSQHIVAFETGAAAVNAGIQFHTVDDDDGTVSPQAVRWARQAAAHHWPTPQLVCVENTHMPAGGVPWSMEALSAVAAAADDIPMHMDGARLFNAVVATGTTPATFAAPMTTVMSCLSKGLGAPIGSLLAGPAALIEAARVERQRLGGAMRQAGVVAAAGLVALRTMVDRLAEDHRRARILAEAVAERWPDAGVEPALVATNMVIFGHPRTDELLDHLHQRGVLGGTIAPGTVRLVTHYDVDDAGIERARSALLGAP